MSKDWIQIIGSICYAKGDLQPRVDEKGKNAFVPLSKVLRIQRFDEDKNDYEDFLIDAVSIHESIQKVAKLKLDISICYLRFYKAEKFEDCFPLYFIITDNVLGVYPQQIDTLTYQGSIWCLVHPDERVRMERYLSGTDNPIHDLVHELRFHPAFAMSRDVVDAKQDFENKKRDE